ncbi:MAG: hypothetical protein AAFW00_13325 [Bacteroidota bacterium]
METIIQASSELMQNHKQAVVMSPQKKFEALQSTEGHALFFSIGTDGVFYLTREKTGEDTGWVKSDLSSALSTYHDGNTITAKTFAVSQTADKTKVDVLVAIEVEDQDYLYIASSVTNDDETWSENLSWEIIAYDDKEHEISQLVIENIFVSLVGSMEYLVVDIAKNPSDTSEFVYRYYIDPSKNVTGQAWNGHDMAGDLNVGTTQSALGRKANDLVDGIYTLGSINSETELLYSPLYNPFNPEIAPNPTRLSVPSGAAALATVANSSEETGLFVAGSKGLTYFAADQQADGASGEVILTNELFTNVTTLHAHTSDDDIVVWGLNQQGQIFYTKCAVGSETNSSAWSVPVPILDEVTEIASYLNNQTSNNVIFAHQDGTNLIQLTQDPMTTMWQQRSIVLPSTDVDDVLAINTYTTHIQLEREDNIPVGGETVEIYSTSPVSVYVNNQFEILSPTVAHSVTTDDTGIITILQETQGLGVVSYKLNLQDSTTVVDVNPLVPIMNTISKVDSGSTLGGIQVTNADDSTQKLVTDSSVTDTDLDNTAAAFQQFSKATDTVPSDGSVIDSETQANSLQATATPSAVWGIKYDADGGSTYHEGDEVYEQFGLQQPGTLQGSAGYGGSENAIEVATGDMLSWLKHALDDVEGFFVELTDGVYHFFVSLGDQLYKFVLNCYHAIANAVEFVLNKIKVFLEDLIKWLGFLFKWKDILRTKDVLKNLLKRFLENSVDQIDEVKSQVNVIFEDVEERINSWAGLEDTQGSLSENAAASGSISGSNDPQSHYGSYHYKNGIQNSSSSTSITYNVTNELSALLETLEEAIDSEADIMESAYNTFQTQVIDQVDTLDVGEIIKRTVAIIADILVESVENIVDTAIDVIEIMVEGVIDILDAEIKIPVLSWLYKEITGSELSFLDLMCLVGAIPVTLIYKVVEEEAPFPDNSTTNAVISASSWSEIKQILNPTPVLQSTTHGTARGVSSLSDSSDVADFKLGLDKTMRILASVGGLVFVGANLLKSADPTSKDISISHGIWFYLTTAPNFIAGLIASDANQSWNAIVGEVVYGITVIEKLLDIFSYKQETSEFMKSWVKITKRVDFCLGVAGMVPTFAALASKQDAKTITLVIANTCWNANRIMTPFADPEKSPKLYAGKMALIAFYGVGQAAVFVEDETIE